MNNTDGLTKEPRTVIGLTMANNDLYHVGSDGVTAIQPIDVSGQMAYVPWFNVWRGRELWLKINAAHVQVIQYDLAQPLKEEERNERGNDS